LVYGTNDLVRFGRLATISGCALTQTGSDEVRIFGIVCLVL
jgi:hypothetical protein